MCDSKQTCFLALKVSGNVNVAKQILRTNQTIWLQHVWYTEICQRGLSNRHTGIHENDGHEPSSEMFPNSPDWKTNILVHGIKLRTVCYQV